MTFRWRYQDEAGDEAAGPELNFGDQADAEAWLEDSWPDLLDTGVEQVTLLDNGAEVYGPMSLRPVE